MNISARDKKVLKIGGAAAVIIVLGSLVFGPALQDWSESRSEAASEAVALEALRDRLLAREDVLREHAVLVSRMGALFTESPAELKTEETQPPSAVEVPPTQEIAQAPEAGQPSPETPSPEVKVPETPAPEAAPPASSVTSLAGFVDQQAKSAGAQLKRMTPRKSTGSARGLKHFRPVMLQVKLQCTMQNLLTLLLALEKGQHFVAVDQMQIKRDLANENNLDVTLDVRGYEATVRKS